MATGDAAGEMATNESPPQASSAQDLVLKVLGAIGTGIGILGFVTLFGGAILWIRAEEAGLPANDAVSVIPNNVLVTTGANFLVPAVLLALSAVALIFTVHIGFDLWRKLRKENKFKEARELLLKAEKKAREAEAMNQHAQAARALATSLSDSADLVQKNAAASDELKASQAREAQKHRQIAEKLEAGALAATASAAEDRAKAENMRVESESVRVTEEFRTELIAGGLILLLLPPILNGAIWNVDFWQVVALIVVAVGVAAVSLAIFATTEKFVWFGVVAFVMVGVYIGFATYFSTTGNPKVEPAAALRAGHPPVVGIFVADTASNLYLGSFSDEEDSARLLVIPRAQVTDLAVGPLVSPPTARMRAVRLALDHCDQTVEVPATDTTPASTRPACSEEQIAELRSFLEEG